MAIVRNFNLFLSAGHSIPLVINANQYDQGESWVFTLFNSDGTQYIPETGAIVGIKSDGLGIINAGSVVDGKVVITETQQMTAAPGKAVFELMIDNGTHGTANFIVLVEPKPGNNADLSDSDLSLIQEALDAVNPLPTGGSVGQVLTKTANGSAWSDAGTPTQEQVADAVSDWADEHITVTTGVVIDTSLSVAGAAADAKKTGDEITDLKSAIAHAEGVPINVKRAMDSLFSHMVTNDYDGSSEYALIHAWASAINVESIAAVYTQSGTVYDTDSLNSLKANLVVTAYYDDDTTATVSDYTLSGTLTVGTSTITVTYEGKTTTFTVTVTSSPYLYYWDFTESLTDKKQGAVATLTNCERNSDGVTINGTSAEGTADNQFIELGNVFGLGKTIDIVLKDVSVDFGNAVGIMFETWDGANIPATFNAFGWRYHATANYVGWGYISTAVGSWKYPANNSSSAKKNKTYFDGDHTLTIKVTDSGEIYVYKDGVDMDIQYAAATTTASGRPYFSTESAAHANCPIIGSKLYYPNFYDMTVVSARIYDTEE